ncbi:DUF305 domain-containing protein [Streptomyces sp. NBC_00249]|uniref:DUF305 domain-containing protein n=1 Tax=Streptomyces sp. NBC_00249 TaxID=2975690 RepID=UPI0022540A37|nr:DUF305 domain-containing protein [Streptomyces sp. NBC_00249]MCX5196951.1 DUF305 domain-containing protein [Streptomyces sp. NBC_00249]
MTRTTTRTYWAAGAAVVLAVLFAVGATVAAPAGGTGAGAGTRPSLYSPDAGFARDMSVHHQQAVEMSFVVRDRTQDEPVRSLAYDIANTQANQRGMMLGWLDLWDLPKVVSGEPPMSWMAAPEQGGHTGHAGHGAQAAQDGALMPGMATKEELVRLGAAGGRDAEVLYLQLMTDHHKGGVAMAEACARQCRVPAERALAQGMAEAQQSELTLMADMLKQRGAAPRG